MSKKNETTESQEKVVTKYDLKMEKRKKEEQQEQRRVKLMKIIAAAVCVAIAVGVFCGIGVSVYHKQQALNQTYVTIGSHEITKLEYDYYYNTVISDYEQTYASLMGYMGLDLSKDLSKQPYSEVMSWKDFFDKMTVNQLKQVKTLNDDAAATGFERDVTESYQNYAENLKNLAESQNLSETEYYQTNYGKYATPKNMESVIRENLVAAAYQSKLEEDNAPSAEEITAYYEEHKQEYDTVDYRILPFRADVPAEASEDEVQDALTTLSKTAEEMKEKLEAGGDFKTLCTEFAQEDGKADYEDEAKDASLKEAAFYAQISNAYGDWLFDAARTEGDLAVLSDVDNRECSVVQFIGRKYDETTNDTIASQLASQRVAEYVSGLEENYQITDTAGKLEYLGKEDAQYAAEAEHASEEAAETETSIATETSTETAAE